MALAAIEFYGGSPITIRRFLLLCVFFCLLPLFFLHTVVLALPHEKVSQPMETGQATLQPLAETVTYTGTVLSTSVVFTPTGNLNQLRRSPTATLLEDGRVLIVGGSGYDSSFIGVNTAEIYDPATEIFTPTANLNHERIYHTATLLGDGRVLIVGGTYAGSIKITAEIYDPVAGTFTPTGNMNQQPPPHTATLLPDGRVLIVGSGDNNSSTTAEVYDPVDGTFTPMANLNQPRSSHTATLLGDGRVLIAGGVLSSSTAEIYDPVAGTFTPTANLNQPRSSHTATLLPDGRVLIVGGDSNEHQCGHGGDL